MTSEPGEPIDITPEGSFQSNPRCAIWSLERALDILRDGRSAVERTCGGHSRNRDGTRSHEQTGHGALCGHDWRGDLSCIGPARPSPMPAASVPSADLTTGCPAESRSFQTCGIQLRMERSSSS